jgi:hypothetical protein
MEPKFNLDRPKISDEEINKHKDFGNLVKQFKEQSIEKARHDEVFIKKRKVSYATVIAGVTVICTLTYFAFNKLNSNKIADEKTTTLKTKTLANTEPKAKKAFIAPPSKKISVPYSSYKVNAAKGGELTHHTASRIKIPKNAFVNKHGEDIVGDVDIQYREFHDQADIIASGIPMTYDSAGTKYTFESAGMFDVVGTQNGEPVFIKPDRSLTVEMASSNPGDHFNQYVLDTVGQNWKCIKRDMAILPKLAAPTKKDEIHEVTQNKTTKAIEEKIAAIPPKIENEKKIYDKKIAALPKTSTPVRPVKSTGRPKFELDVDYKEFPELSAFRNAVFEVGAENKNYSKEISQITWSEAKISEGPDKGKNYILTLKNRMAVEKFVVYPALCGADYDNALKIYERNLESYNTLLAKRQLEEKKLQDEMIAKQQTYTAEQKKLSEDLIKEQIRMRREQEKQLSEQFASMGNQLKVTRLFNVSNFGIYNSDCARDLPRGGLMEPVFSMNESKVRNADKVYLVDHGRNMVYEMPYGHIVYDPKHVYSVCVINAGEIFLCDKQTFMALLKTDNNKVPLTALPAEANNVSDFRTALGI